MRHIFKNTPIHFSQMQRGVFLRYRNYRFKKANKVYASAKKAEPQVRGVARSDTFFILYAEGIFRHLFIAKPQIRGI